MLGTFTLDVTAGVTHMSSIYGGLMLNAEMGYTFDSRAPGDLHAFNVTTGIGYGSSAIGVTYQPRLLLGSDDESFTVGVRNGLMLHGAGDIFSIEASHRVLGLQGKHYDITHDLQVTLGLNATAVIFTALGLQSSDSTW